jgi:hypothetical protein
VTNSGKKLGPRACAICGPVIEECHVCRSKTGHTHVTVVSRHGEPLGQVAACGAHTPPGPFVAPIVREKQPQPLSVKKKRQRDRERRLAQRIVLDRHADEVERELEEIRRRQS